MGELRIGQANNEGKAKLYILKDIERVMGF